MIPFTLPAVAVIAPAPVPEAATPEEVATAFLDAFRAMDERRFDRFFASDVTMFFPNGPFPRERVDGREKVLAAFHGFFAGVKERGRSMLNIVPLDQRIDRFGEIAIVTFRLDSSETVGRRSILMKRFGTTWRIVHFHASTMDK